MRHVAAALRGGAFRLIRAHRLVRICKELEASVQARTSSSALALVAQVEAESPSAGRRALEQELEDRR